VWPGECRKFSDAFWVYRICQYLPERTLANADSDVTLASIFLSSPIGCKERCSGMLSGQVGASTSSAVLEFGGGPASVSSSRLRTPAAADNTNVVRLFNLLDLSDRATQVAYYDPGVGTFSSPGAWSPPARLISRYAGLMFGAGLRENLGQLIRS
jgi:Uncharacterized alpha/beta hydrolase domain (DUF2235)